MNYASKLWHQIEMDPPSYEWAAKISIFIQNQLVNPLSERDSFTRWKLCENEVHSGFSSAMVVGPQKTIVSTCTVTPKLLWHDGRVHLWGEIGDTFTDSGYIRNGMFGALVAANVSRAQAANFKIVYGLPNDQSLPGYVNKLGFEIKNNLVLDSYFLPVSIKVTMRTRLGKIPIIRDLLCNKSVIRFSRKISLILLKIPKPKYDDVQIQQVDTFGSEFDDLWMKVRMVIPNAQVRDARYLNWRFSKSPFKFVVFKAKRDGKLLGYIATLTLQSKDNNGLIHTMLLDWLYDPVSESSTSKKLLFAAMHHAFEQDADIISSVSSRVSPMPLPFSLGKFIRRKREMPVIIYGNDEGRKLIDDLSAWHFTLSDTDSF
jgi:hypothetical protein